MTTTPETIATPDPNGMFRIGSYGEYGSQTTLHDFHTDGTVAYSIPYQTGTADDLLELSNFFAQLSEHMRRISPNPYERRKAKESVTITAVELEKMHKLLRKFQEDSTILRTSSVVEIAAFNFSVRDYIKQAEQKPMTSTAMIEAGVSAVRRFNFELIEQNTPEELSKFVSDVYASMLARSFKPEMG